MGQGGLASRLGARASNRPGRTAILAGIAFLVAAPLGATAFDALDPYVFEDPSTESAKALAATEAATGVRADGTMVALVRTPTGTSEGRARMREVSRTLAEVPGVVSVRSPAGSAGGSQIAMDGRSAYAVATVDAGADSAEITEEAETAFAGQEDVELGGVVVTEHQTAEQTEKDLQRAELFAFPLLFVLSFVFFRGLVAAALPLILGGAAIVGALFVMRLMHEVEPLSVLSLNCVTGLGLGLAIDYSLFIVSRFREELAAGRDVQGALQRTLATAGRTVAFSGFTVACAMACLLLFPQQFVYSMGLGGIAVSLLSAGAALTLLPALLALLGPRVNALAPARLARAREATERPDSAGRWYRFSRWVMRHPVSVAIVATVVLLALAFPATRLAFVPADAGLLHDETSGGRVDAALAADYELDATYPIILQFEHIAADSPNLAAYGERLARIPGVAAVFPPQPVGSGASLDVISGVGRFTPAAQDLVREIRGTNAPVPVRVSGIAASSVDEPRSVADRLPLALAALVISTGTLLFVMTRSLILPIKALLMNFLSVAAAFGLLVLVFQDGRLEGLFDFTSDGGILIGIALLIAAAAFGLSTDYGVFAFSRMREALAEGASNDEAVALALERTSRLVTSAALLFAVAMGSLVTGLLIGVKETGFGLAAAVLIDATIVRALLVPALMKLLGDLNWWAPRRLRSIFERTAEVPAGELKPSYSERRRARAAAAVASSSSRPRE